MSGIIKRGTTQTVAANTVVDGTGAAITSFAGWTARGVIRADTLTGVILATFDDDPGVGEQPVTFDGPNSRVSIEITPAMNLEWSARNVHIQIKIFDPSARVARIIDETYLLDTDAVPLET